MVDKRNEKTPVAVDKENEQDTVARSRRDLLKRAVITMPAVLTLQSGAALARSSNLISKSPPHAAKDARRRMLCLDERYVDGIYNGGRVADLGEPAYGHVAAIKRRRYYIAPNGDPVGRGRMCKDGGTYSYLKNGEWKQTDYVPKGMLVSATALSSFAGRLEITEI